MNNMNRPMPAEPKKLTWLWLTLVIIVILLGGYFIWQNINKNTPVATASPSPSATPSADLSAVDTDLNNLDNDLSQLDKIDASEDEAPSL